MENTLFSVESTRDQLTQIVDIFTAIPEQEQLVKEFAKLRQLEPSTLHKARAFHVEPDYQPYLLPKELRHDALGFCRNDYYVFSGRFVYPVMDTRGKVAGFCGYDYFDKPKYLDSVNYGYRAKTGMFYGEELLPAYYKSTDPVFFVEGIVCCLWLRENGFNALACLGSQLSTYMVAIMSRFGHRCIVIPDSDGAGNKFAKQARYYLRSARVLQSRVAKDVDDSRKELPTLADELRKITASPFGISKYFT